MVLGAYGEANKRDPLSDKYINLFKRDPQAFQSSGLLNIELPDVGLEASILISAIIHHFWASLDYLIYELSIHDSKKVHEHTQFVIADTKADIKKDATHPKTIRGFNSRAKRELAGLTPRHVAIIEALQPYNGWDWTRILRDISNQDKHRALVLTTAYRETTFGISVEGTILDNEERVIVRGITSGKEIHAEAESTVFVVFEQWKHLPVVKTLERIKIGVRHTLELFKDEFK